MKSIPIALAIIYLSNFSEAAPPNNYILARETENSRIYFNKQNDPSFHDPKVDVYVEHKDSSKSFFNAGFRCSDADIKNKNTGFFYKEEFKNKIEIKYKSTDDIAATIRAICELLPSKKDEGFESNFFKIKINPNIKPTNNLIISPVTNGNYSITSSNNHKSVGLALAEVSIGAQQYCKAQPSNTWIFNSQTESISSFFGIRYKGKIDFFCVNDNNSDYSIQEFIEPKIASDYIFFPGRYGMLALTNKNDTWRVENKELATGAAEKYCSEHGKTALISHQNNSGNNGWYAQFHFICN
jgi:hypothetical protein